MIAWQPRRGWFVRTAATLAGVAAAIWQAVLVAAPAARLWAKIIAPIALTWVLVHFVHLVMDRPWTPDRQPDLLRFMRRAVDVTAFLAAAGMLALVGMRVRAERAAGGWKVELGRESGGEEAP